METARHNGTNVTDRVADETSETGGSAHSCLLLSLLGYDVPARRRLQHVFDQGVQNVGRGWVGAFRGLYDDTLVYGVQFTAREAIREYRTRLIGRIALEEI